MIWNSWASPTTITLRPVADAEIQAADPDHNFGSQLDMVSGALGPRAGQVVRRGLLRFDLAGRIPSGAIINSTTLQVRVVKVPSGPASSIFDLWRILQPWSEGGVTWNSRLPNTLWEEPGVTGAGDSVAQASSTTFVAGVKGSYTFASSPGIVADVQGWVNDPGTNDGWLLISENELTPKTARRFATREDAVNAPVLTVVFTIPPPSILGEPQDQTADEAGNASFSVTAGGVPPLRYQWQFNGNDILDATNGILTLTNVQTNQAGLYSVRVLNAGGITLSQAATLTVIPLTELRPRVSFTSPVSGMKFPEHADVPVTGTVTTSNATLSFVEFFTNGTPVLALSNSPFSFVLSNLSAGTFDLNANVTDSLGRTNGSATVSFRVLPPPRLALVSPANGARFAPLATNVTLTAVLLPPTQAADVVRVQFFQNSSVIGELAGPPLVIPWIPPAPGDYLLKAVATDEAAQSGTSANVAVHVFIPETIPPTVTITNSPPNFFRTASPLVQLAGTASDDRSVLSVDWQVNDGSRIPAAGTNRWAAVVTLVAGPNAVRVRSVDQAGNDSPPATRFITYVVPWLLRVRTNGLGRVTPDLTRLPLEIGKLYSLTAIPSPGQIFSRWDGAPWQGALLNFQMISNLVLTANFIPNPFPAGAGNYTGLSLDTNGVAPDSSAFFTLQVGMLGAFTGKLMQGGGSFAFRGQFSPAGEARTALLRPGRVPLAVMFRLDLTSGTDQVRGTITDGVWVSELLGNRNVFNARTNPATQAGTRAFTWRQAGVANRMIATATAKIATSGSVTFAGRMVDGRMFASGAEMARNGDVPFYIPFGTTEVVAGWLNFGLPPQPPISGDGSWVRSGTNGFATLVETP